MANSSSLQLSLFMFLLLVASDLTQQAFAKGDQCKVNKDCVKYCAHRPHCPVLCLGGLCLCNCAATATATQVHT
ncbi:hypothetical protein SESBI_19026 [Sesbania bispinosa]|nr:hypothetical protein SESBI_19026 [Sesbania bispinosa]